MATATVPFVSVEEYLRSDYEPDAEYVDGQIEERTVGEWDHGDLQAEITTLFRNHAREWGIRAAAEIRIQVSPTRFRVPDVCVVASSEPKQQIVRTPPILCIEVLSPEDRLPRVLRRCRDFLAMGVPEVWIVKPRTRSVSVLHKDGSVNEHVAGDLRLRGMPIAMSLTALFAVLDQN